MYKIIHEYEKDGKRHQRLVGSAYSLNDSHAFCEAMAGRIKGGWMSIIHDTYEVERVADAKKS